MGNNSSPGGRDPFFDTCKYLLIVLVIAGHVMDGYKHLYGWMEYLYSLIYLFHMPFFAFISGYFSKRLTARKLVSGSLLLAESFLILHTGFLCLYNRDWPEWHAVLSPWYAPWYLLSLIWWRCAAFLCLRLGRPAACLAIAAGIGLCSGFLYGVAEPTGFLALSRTCLFLPFFMAGLYTTPMHVQKLRRMSHLPFAVLALLTALSLVPVSGTGFNLIEYGGGFHWDTAGTAGALALFGGRLYFLSAAALLTLCLLNLLPSLRTCAGFGTKTMFFFSYHIFFVYLLNYRLRGLLHIAHPGWWYPLLGCVLTVLCLNLLSRIRLFTLLLNPVSSLASYLRRLKKA